MDKMYDLKQQQDGNNFDWSKLISTDNIYKFLYFVQIIECFLEETENKEKIYCIFNESEVPPTDGEKDTQTKAKSVTWGDDEPTAEAIPLPAEPVVPEPPKIPDEGVKTPEKQTPSGKYESEVKDGDKTPKKEEEQIGSKSEEKNPEITVPSKVGKSNKKKDEPEMHNYIEILEGTFGLAFEQFSESGTQKVIWLQSFLDKGGFDFLLSQFVDEDGLFSHKRQYQDLNPFEKRCMCLIQRLIKIFLLAIFTATDTSRMPELIVMR